MAIAEIRLRRAEQDIETLRSTQSAMLQRIDSFSDTLTETRDIAAENRKRLERVEDRLTLLEEVVLENRDLIRENRDMILENRKLILENRDLILDNRKILLAIADHLDLTLELPPQDPPSD